MQSPARALESTHRAGVDSPYSATRLEQDTHDFLPPFVMLCKPLVVPLLHLIELSSTSDKVDIHERYHASSLGNLPAAIADCKDQKSNVSGEEVGHVPVALEEDGEAVEAEREH